MKLSKRKRRENHIVQEQLIYRECGRKKSYETEFLAWDTAKRLRAWGGVDHSLYTYHCRYCGKFHLTKTPNGGLKA